LIIGLYLLTPVLKIFVDNALKKDFEYFLLLYFIIGSCIPTWNTIADSVNKIIPIAPQKIYFPVLELTGYAGYYIAGFYFSKYSLKKSTNVILIILGVISLFISIIGTGIIAYYYRKFLSVDIGFYNRSGPFCMFVTFGMFVVFKMLIKNIRLTNKQILIIQHFSKKTFGIYLAHWTILLGFNHIGINSTLFNPVFSIPVMALVIFISSYIVTILIKQIPVLKECVV
jgi:hypothetical protein